MKKVNVREVKAKFARYLERAGRGERIVIHRYNEPVAELRAIEPARTRPRPIGPVAGRPTFDLMPSFFEPLDDADLRAWEGMAGAVYPPQAQTARVADTPAARPFPPVRRIAKRKRS